MKKTFKFAFAAVAVICVASCGGRGGNKTENQDETEAVEAVAAEDVAEVKAAPLPDGDFTPAEWADRYGVGQCPMTLAWDGKESKVYFRNGGDLADWTRSELNTDGWYFYNDRVISSDGKWAIGPEIESLSSCCTYVAQPYDGPTLSEEERSRCGELVAVHSFVPLWIRQMALAADGDEEPEMAKRGLKDSFNAGENINFIIDANPNYSCETGVDSVSVWAFPHELNVPAKGFVKDEDASAAVFKIERLIEPDDFCRFYKAAAVIPNDGEDKGVGLFDIVFTYNGIISEYLTVNSVKSE